MLEARSRVQRTLPSWNVWLNLGRLNLTQETRVRSLVWEDPLEEEMPPGDFEVFLSVRHRGLECDDKR